MARRQWPQAEAAFHEAPTTAEAIQEPTQLWNTEVALARLARVRGQDDIAEQLLQRARTVLDAVKANVRHPVLRASLEKNIVVPSM